MRRTRSRSRQGLRCRRSQRSLPNRLPGRIDWLAAIGVAFDRQPSGALALGREAGHSRHRMVHAGGDRTGAAVMGSLRAAVLERPDIRVLEPFDLIDLVTVGRSGGRCPAGGPGRPPTRRARAQCRARNRWNRRLFRSHDESGNVGWRGARCRCPTRRPARRPRIRPVSSDRARDRCGSPPLADRGAARRGRDAPGRIRSSDS